MSKKKKKTQRGATHQASTPLTGQTVIDKSTVDQVHTDRKTELDILYPELKREDFASDAEYRQALVAQYKAMRQKEYGYVVQNEAMKAYTVFSDANKNAGRRVENEKAWNGYRNNKNASDTCITRAPVINKATNGPQNGSFACCAITGASMTSQISGKMGYDGKNNLIQPKSRYNSSGEVTNKNNIVSAAEIDNLQSIAPQYRFRPSKPITLSQAVKNGSVGIGDEISIRIKQPQDNTTSGCHAMVIVDIQRDKNNNVVSYTLMANNPPCLQVVDANSPNDKYGSKNLHCAVRTSKWIGDKINGEIGQNESIESIEKKVAAERRKLQNLTDDMYRTETNYVAGKHYNDKTKLASSTGFGSVYNKKAGELHQVTENERQIAENRRQEQELAQREALLREREEQCDAEIAAFLAQHPQYSQNLQTTLTNGQCIIIPEETTSRDVAKRAENVAARSEALRQKKEELDQREQDLNASEANLKQAKAEAQIRQKQTETTDEKTKQSTQTTQAPKPEQTTQKEKKDQKKEQKKPQDKSNSKKTPAVVPLSDKKQNEPEQTPAVVPLSDQKQNKPQQTPAVVPLSDKKQNKPQQTPAVVPVEGENRRQQKADFKEEHFNGEVDGHQKTSEAKKENARIAAQKEEAQKQAYEEARKRYEKARKSKSTMNYGKEGVTYDETKVQSDHTTVVKPVNPNLVQNNQQERQ